MTDTSLRKLERRFRALRRVEDEAAWLRARVQVGAVSEDAVRLAAWLGSEAARAALELRACDESLSVYERLERLKEWGAAPPVRAALALAHGAYAAWERVSGAGYLAELRRCLGRKSLAATEAWIAAPSKQRAAAAKLAGGSLRQGHRARVTSRSDGMRWCAPAVASDAVTASSPGEAAAVAKKLLAVASTAMDQSEAWSLVVADLLPWALGYADPLRDRVEARERDAAGEQV